MKEVRRLVISDIPKIIELEEKFLGETLGQELLEASSNVPYLYFYVVTFSNQVVGYIGSYLLYESGEILNFVVDEVYQHQGYGQMLLDKVITKCQEIGVKNLTLEVNVNNQKGINFYQKNQFKTVNIRKHYYEDGSDAYLMLKEL